VAHYRRHTLVFTAPLPSSRLCCGCLPSRAGSGRRGPLGRSCRRTGAVCPACRDRGKGCDSSTCTGGWSWPPPLAPVRGHAAAEGGRAQVRTPAGAEFSTLPPKVPGPGTVAGAIPTRSRALLVIAAVLEGEPAPAAFPRCFPVLQLGTEPLLSLLSPWHRPGPTSLCRWGEKTRESNSSSLGNKSHVYIGELLACWQKRPGRSVTLGSSRPDRPAPLRLAGGGSQQQDPASFGPRRALLSPARRVSEVPERPESSSRSCPLAAGASVPDGRAASSLLDAGGAAGRERWQP